MSIAVSRTAVIPTLLVASLGVNLLQARALNYHKGRLSALRAERTIQLGTSMPRITGYDLKGARTEIAFDQESKPTLLYVFTPSCGWCERNVDNIRTIVRETGGRYRFVGLSLTDKSVSGYVTTHAFDFPVVVVSGESRSALRLGGTPQMLVVSEQGKLLKNWVGAPQDDLETEIEDYLKLRLPGLTPVQASRSGTSK